jgi:hypothetical protein
MTERSPHGRGFGLRLGLGVTTLVACLATMVWPDWIEEVFHIDPDRGNGTLEAAIVVVLGAVSIVSLAQAWSIRRRATDV